MNRVFRVKKFNYKNFCTKSNSNSYVKIGNVSKPIQLPASPQLVPVKYLPSELSQKLLYNLKWMLQKDVIGQDIFLIGPPGKSRRQLAMMFLELTNQEMEYIVLSRDTTESDIKQRREIRDGSAVYINQSAVRAALLGRVLVLDGIEKAERNVLPILNNLLENREMQLEDGRFLMAAHRFDDLSAKFGEDLLHNLQLVRCSDRFRVIALGLPTPKFRGNPLDPPLRSRFQARHIVNVETFEQSLEQAREMFRVPKDRIFDLSSFAYAINTSEIDSLQLPYFPTDNLTLAFKLLENCPHLTNSEIIERLYPIETLLNSDQRNLIDELQTKFNLKSSKSVSSLPIESIKKTNDGFAQVKLGHQKLSATFQVATGCDFTDQNSHRAIHATPSSSSTLFVSTPKLEKLLSDMVLSHSVGDLCVIAPKGAGKVTLCREFGRRLGYEVDHILLYADMTARDLLQQRMTDPNTGDTNWRNSPFVEAALNGRLVLLEGLQNVNPGTLAVLYRLIMDRELDLFDGTRLLRDDRYSHLMKENNWTDDDMRSKGILRIDPRFRIIALAQPPIRHAVAKPDSKQVKPTKSQSPTAAVSSTSNHWLSPELLSVFLFHSHGPLSREDEQHIVKQRVPNCDPNYLNQLMNVVHHLRQSSDNTEISLSENLSTRQVIRIAQRMSQFPKDNLSDAIRQACLYTFLPRTAASTLDQVLRDHGLADKSQNISSSELTWEIKEGNLRIGSASVKVSTNHPSHSQQPTNADTLSKIPLTLFYDSQEHLSVMEAILKQWATGDFQHFLLVGNQGVGKNKIVDRLLELLGRPREYIQLHRDTTVQSLIMHTAIKDRQLVYEDSPLVTAVKKGHVLVIDEADKAPTQVTSVLRTLILSGQMQLPDGRRIVPWNKKQTSSSQNFIPLHPDFRMIVLANRPGFPFLGNDFFNVLGDTFSCHVVNNPDPASEIQMLQRYGPQVPLPVLQKLVALFTDLRHMADEGIIQYPYSTRELVNVVKHLNNYPTDGLATVLKNVFDFDLYNSDLRDTVNEALARHGIPLISDSEGESAVNIAPQYPLGQATTLGQWTFSSPSRTRIEHRSISVKGPVYQPLNNLDIEYSSHRSNHFTELDRHIRIPLEDYNVIGASALSAASGQKGGRNHDVLYLATLNPIHIISINMSNPSDCCKLSLEDLFPNASASFIPRIQLAAMPSPQENSLLCFEAFSNTLFKIDMISGELHRILSPGLPDKMSKVRLGSWNRPNTSEPQFNMINAFSQQHQMNFACFHSPGGKSMEVFDCQQGKWHSVFLPSAIERIHFIGDQSWLLESKGNSTRYVLRCDDVAQPAYSMRSLTQNSTMNLPHPLDFVTQSSCQEVVEEKTIGPSDTKTPTNQCDRWTFHKNELIGFLNLPKESSQGEIVSYKLNERVNGGGADGVVVSANLSQNSHFPSSYECLPQVGMLFRTLPVGDCPSHVTSQFLGTTKEVLQVIHLRQGYVQYLPIPKTERRKTILSWFLHNLVPIHLHSTSSCNSQLLGENRPETHDLVTVDTLTGHVLVWQLTPVGLENSLSDWKRMVGSEDEEGGEVKEANETEMSDGLRKKRQLLLERKINGVDLSLKGPKFGKIDSKNAPHVGGNTWAGGTGGRDTAGLGGVGGPFRLDAGHDVHQVPDEAKAAVPQHIRDAARDMAEKAWRQRLREIELSEYDAELYESYAKKVRPQISALRNIFENLQARSKERDWLRHQNDGDLDEEKLVEGLLGERAVYKRRADKPPDPTQPLQKPKVLRIVADVSGSMYRFNGQDQRMERQLESILMILEACATLPGLESRLCLEIFGHSGEGPQFPFLRGRDKQQFANEKQRLNILKGMLAHSQFCISGDHTLEAVRVGQSALSTADWADERFLVILSDANLDRYGIHPRQLSRLLVNNNNEQDENRQVNTYAIFIGSLGDQAESVARHLPAGHAFVCLDNKKLPQILKQIFTDTILKMQT